MKHGEVIQSSTVGLFNHQQVVKSKNAPLLLPGVSSPRPAGESSPTILLVGGLPVWAVRPSPAEDAKDAADAESCRIMAMSLHLTWIGTEHPCAAMSSSSRWHQPNPAVLASDQPLIEI